MPIENEQLHYRARFEVFPFEEVGSPAQMVKEAMWKWVLWKESRQGRPSPLVHLGEGAREGFMSGKLTFPILAEGELPSAGRSSLRVDALGPGDSGRDLWALEYDEPDATVTHRRWRTKVGLSSDPDDGTCIVNVRIAYYLVPGYVGQTPRPPVATVPNFVKWIVGDEGYQSCVGETAIKKACTHLRKDNFQDFADDLVSEGRELPLVLVTTDWNGDTPVGDVSRMAEALLGMANVYVADWRDPSVRAGMQTLFRRGEASSLYRCEPGSVRIYQAGVDLLDAHGYTAHRFFTHEKIVELCEDGPRRFWGILAQGLVRAFVRGSNDVIDVSDVEWHRSKAERARLARKLADLRNSQAHAVAPEGREELERRVGELEAELAERDEFIDYCEAELQKKSDELEAMREKRNSDYNEASGALYRANTAETRAETLERENQALMVESNAIRAMDHIPACLCDELDLAERLWPTRIVVLEEARRSADSFRGNLDEEWQIIKGCATTLWQLRFEEGSANIAEDFRVATGYDIAMTEGKLTKVDPKLMKLRKRMYRGQEVDITPHVKGRAKGEKNAFRLHFCFDDARRLVVIGHCGGHLDTAGTRRMHS